MHSELPGVVLRRALMSLVVVVVAAGVALAGTTIAPSGAAAAEGDSRWALVIGINDYAGRTKDTIGGVGDAADVGALLRRSGWRDDHVRVLVDRQATAAAIRDGLRWLRERTTDSSFTVFHYSGHVKQRGGDLDRDGEALDEYLWGADNGFISDRELADSLRATRGRLWVDISGCEAAGFDDGLSSRRHLLTASSREPEKSYEYPDWKNSVFTGLLVDQGMLQRHAAPAADGRISIQAAFDYAARKAAEMTSGQRMGAQHPVIAGGDGRAWYLVPPSPPPAPARRCTLTVCFGR